MIDPKVVGSDIKYLGPARLSYAHLFQPWHYEGNDELAKYSVNILIPKDEVKTIEAIKKAIAEAVKIATVKVWGGDAPRNFESPLRDGDESNDPNYHGHYWLNAKSKRKPLVYNQANQPATEEEVYSGCYAYCAVNFYGYKIGKKGIACAINCVKKYKDGEPFGGGATSYDMGELPVADVIDDDDL